MRSAERIAAWVLFWGGTVSVGIMAVGLLATALVGHGAADLQRVFENRLQLRPADTFTTLEQVRRGLAHKPVDPLAVAEGGVLMLIATPVAALLGAGIAFSRGGDYRYAAVCAVLLALLAVSTLFRLH